jgi:hypothetical protein
LDRIFVADAVFQPRDGLEEYHVRNLAAALRDNERPLDKILVVPIGDRHFVVDGHHRLAAYIAVDWPKGIPVQVFEEGLDAAEVAAIGNNAKDKLSVPKYRKLESAWKLVKRGTHSIAVIANNAMVSPRTISNMRDRLKELGEDASDYTWEEAKKGKLGGGDFDAESWVEREAISMAQRVCSVHNKKEIVKNAEIFAAMIEMVNSDLVSGILDLWFDSHQETVDLLIEEREERATLEPLDI